MKNKKGVALNGLYAAVLAIIVVGIAIGIGIYVLNQTALATSTTAYTTLNETITPSSVGGGVLLSGSSYCGAQTFAIKVVQNKTSGALISSGNYTLGASSGRLNNLTPQYTGDWNVSYTFTATADNSTTSSCRVLTTTGTGIGNMSDWIAVIVVVLAASIVLGIVISSFRGRTGV